MLFFLVLWPDAPIEEPIWMAYEVDEVRSLSRRIEVFRGGICECIDFRADNVDGLISIQFDIDEADLNDLDLAIFEIKEVDFQRYWKIASNES